MRLFATGFVFLFLIAPYVALAFPFGGQASIVRPCYNSAIFARLGPPRGGDFIWTPSTRTYQFGPPRSVGQWLLGLASVPYHCVVSLSPVDVWPGTAIMMMGSSQASGFNFGGGTPGGGVPLQPTRTLGQTTGLATQSGVERVLISEVFPIVDTLHGTDPSGEWIELYNATSVSINISGWKLANASSSITVPPGTTLSPKTHILLSPTLPHAAWSVSTSTTIAQWFAQGMSSSDKLVLTDTNDLKVDALSWGVNTSEFQPPIFQPMVGQSIIRTSFAQDTDRSVDWIVNSLPNPGR